MLDQKSRILVFVTVLALGIPGVSARGASAIEVQAQGDSGSARGVVTGIVWDSISDSPLGDAGVFLWHTFYRGVSDAQGRYRIEGIPDGEYSLLFFHTLLGEIGVSPGPVPVSIADSSVAVDLATPSRETVFRSQCLLETRPSDAAVVAGRVYDGGADVPLGGALVMISWETDERARSASTYVRSGADGWFRVCDAPSDRPVLVGVDFIGRQSRRRELDVRDGYAASDFPLYPLCPSHIKGTLTDASSGNAIQGAVTWIRGTALSTLSDGGHFEFDDVPPGR